MSTLVRPVPLGREAARAMPEEAVPLGLLLITLLALLLRLFRIGASSLWVDELITIWQGTVLGESLWRQFLDDLQSPLPMVITTFVSRFSQSEAWLRLPSALAGAATPALLFAAGRHVIGRRGALFAALILAVHPMHIYHSQEVRGYTFLLFFGLAAAALALGARGRPGNGRIALIGLTGAAAVLSNLQGLFWMGGLALGLVAAGRIRRGSLLRWACAFGAILLLTSPWWSASMQVHEVDRLVPGEETGEALRGESTFSVWSIPYAGFALSVGPSLGPSTQELYTQVLREEGGAPSLPRRHLPWVTAAAIVASWLTFAGLRALRRRSVEILLWAAVPVLFALALGIRNVKPFNPRYVLAALPSLLLLFGAGLDALPRRRALVALAAWLVLAVVALDRHYFETDYMHEDVRAAARLIESREGADDVILAPTVYRVFDHYYRGDSPVHNFPAPMLGAGEQVRARLQELSPGRRYLWYVRSRPWHGDPRGVLVETLDSRYHADAIFQVPGVEVRLYDRQPPAAPGSALEDPESGDGPD